MATIKPQKTLPTPADLPTGLTASIVAPPSGQPPTNVLILLHGLGDNHLPFERLGAQLQLPNTACIAVRAPFTLPFEQSSFHWCDDVIFDSTTNGLDPDGGCTKATATLLDDLVAQCLVAKCNYKARDIVFFGLGQGGMLALNAAVVHNKEFGGVVSIGGPLPAEAPASSSPNSKTPVIVCSGQDSHWVTAGAHDKLKQNFEHVKTFQYRRRGDTMPKDREEMLPIMQFFASRLRTPAPTGAVEIG